MRVSSLRILILIGGYLVFRCWPYQIKRVECVSLWIPSANDNVMDLTLLVEIASFITYVAKVYLTIPSWSLDEYPLSGHHPLEPHKPLPFLETKQFSVNVRVCDVPLQRREKLESVLRENGAFLNIEGGWRHRKPIRKHFKLKK